MWPAEVKEEAQAAADWYAEAEMDEQLPPMPYKTPPLADSSSSSVSCSSLPLAHASAPPPQLVEGFLSFLAVAWRTRPGMASERQAGTSERKRRLVLGHGSRHELAVAGEQRLLSELTSEQNGARVLVFREILAFDAASVAGLLEGKDRFIDQQPRGNRHGQLRSKVDRLVGMRWRVRAGRLGGFWLSLEDAALLIASMSCVSFAACLKSAAR